MSGKSFPALSMRQRLTHAWTRRGALAWCLWPVSWLYGALVSLRHTLYRLGIFKTRWVAAKIVVVGNVVAGGGGKTPVVMALVTHLQARGLKVGVVSRGYGRRTQDCREVHADSPAIDVGDEPALIRQACNAPVFVAVKRFDAATALLARYPDTQVIVCDDGLQHHGLHRDLEICVFDDRGVGNGFLLPAGPLREPWPRSTQFSALRRLPTQLVLHTGQRPAFRGGFRAVRALADHALRRDGSKIALADLQGKPLAAVAGVAQPQQFFDMLAARGLTLLHTDALPDHYDYNSWKPNWDVDETILFTEKDAVKLWRSPIVLNADAFAVPLVVTLEAAFLSAVDSAIDEAFDTSVGATVGAMADASRD